MRKMVDMAKTEDDAEEAAERISSIMEGLSDDYPAGLCLCLTQPELDKLGLDTDCQVGDLLHVFAMTRVTSVSMSDNELMGPQCRIELQIVALGLEDEMNEAVPDPTPGQLSRRKRYEGV